MLAVRLLESLSQPLYLPALLLLVAAACSSDCCATELSRLGAGVLAAAFAGQLLLLVG
jgi:hypothetical protein